MNALEEGVKGGTGGMDARAGSACRVLWLAQSQAQVLSDVAQTFMSALTFVLTSGFVSEPRP